jgi:hypothetical protein
MGEAQDELTIKLSKKIEGSYVEPHKMTLAEYLLHWLTVKKASTAPKTHERYAHVIVVKWHAPKTVCWDRDQSHENATYQYYT